MKENANPFENNLMQMAGRMAAMELVVAAMLAQRSDALALLVSALKTLRELELVDGDDLSHRQRFEAHAIAEAALRRIAALAGIEPPVS